MSEDSPKVLILGSIESETVDQIRRSFGSVQFLDLDKLEQVRRLPTSLEAVVVRSPFKLNSSVLDVMPALKLVIRAGSGSDNIDLSHLAKRGVEYTTCAVNSNAVAELAFAFMLASARNLCEVNDSTKKSLWLKFDTIGCELNGKTLLIVGLGRIGKRVAEIAKAFNMTVVAVESSNNFQQKAEFSRQNGIQVSLDIGEFAPVADFVVLSCPLNESTRGLISKSNLKIFKSSVVLVNVARGAVWDFDSVLQALDTGLIGAACCDVYETEPPLFTVDLRHPRLLMTPHIGAQTTEAQSKIGQMVLSKLKAKLEQVL